MLRQPLMSRLLGEDLRLVAQQDNDLVFHVDAGVIVILEFVSGSAVPNEDHRPGERSGGGEADGFEISIDGKLLFAWAVADEERVVGLELCAGGDREGLQITLRPRRLEAQR